MLMLLVIIAMGLSLLDQSSFACVPLAITLIILASSIKKNSENEMSFSQEQSQTDATYMEDIDAEAWMHTATTLDNDLNQAGDVIKSATNAIAGSLTGLEEASSSQQAVLGEMVSELLNVTQSNNEEQTKGIDNSAQENGTIIEGFINTIESIRTETRHMSSDFVSITEQAKTISDSLKSVDEIISQTNLLALNAAIEAARAGELAEGLLLSPMRYDTSLSKNRAV